jgi:hypothetical protein
MAAGLDYTTVCGADGGILIPMTESGSITHGTTPVHGSSQISRQGNGTSSYVDTGLTFAQLGVVNNTLPNPTWGFWSLEMFLKGVDTGNGLSILASSFQSNNGGIDWGEAGLMLCAGALPIIDIETGLGQGPPAEWNHYVITCSPATIKLYVNGTLVAFSNPGDLSGSNAPVDPPITVPGTMLLFANRDATTGVPYLWNGAYAIAEMRRYPGELSQLQCIEHYAARAVNVGLTPAANAYPLASTFGPHYYPLVMALAPVCYYRGDETAGTQMVDRSGLGNHGAILATSTDAAIVEWLLGQSSALSDGDHAIKFQSTNPNTGPVAGILSTVTGPGAGGAFAISCLVQLTTLPSTPGNAAVVCASDQAAQVAQGFEVDIDDTGAVIMIVSRATNLVLAQTAGGMIVPGVWTHIVATYDGNTARIYINGALQATNTNALVGATTFGNPVCWCMYPIGSFRNNGGTGALVGAIDEMLFFTGNLSAANAAAMYAAVTGPPPVPPQTFTAGTDKHYFEIFVLDPTGSTMLAIPHDIIESFSFTDAINGGSSTSNIVFRRPFVDGEGHPLVGYLNRVFAWFWHGKIPRPVNPTWAGYVVDNDAEMKPTTGRFTSHLEGDMSLLQRGLVIENVNPGVGGNPGLDAADYLRHLTGPQGYAPTAFADFSGIPTTMFALEPMQFQQMQLGDVIDAVVKSGRTAFGTMWIWLVRSDYLGNRTFSVLPDQNPNVITTLPWNQIFPQEMCSDYVINTTYRQITNIIYVQGGQDPTTGQQIVGTFEDSSSVAAFGPWETSVSNISLITAAAAEAYAEAYCDIYGNPQAQGSIELLKPDPNMLSGAWVQVWESPSTVKQMRIASVKWESKKGRIVQTLSPTAPTPYLDAAIYQMGVQTTNALTSSLKSLPLNTQQSYNRFGGEIGL